MADGVIQDLEYITPEEMVELETIDPEAYLIMMDLVASVTYKIKGRAFFSDLSNIDIHLDGGTFL